MPIEVLQRPLHLSEITALIASVRETPNIIAYQESEWRAFGSVWVAEVDSRFAGVAVTRDCGRWTYLAVSIVLEPYRGRGVGKRLFRVALESAVSRKRAAFIASRNPQVVRWMREVGMSVSGQFWRTPLPILLYFSTHFLTLFRIRAYLEKKARFGPQPAWVYGTLRPR